MRRAGSTVFDYAVATSLAQLFADGHNTANSGRSGGAAGGVVAAAADDAMTGTPKATASAAPTAAMSSHGRSPCQSSQAMKDLQGATLHHPV